MAKHVQANFTLSIDRGGAELKAKEAIQRDMTGFVFQELTLETTTTPTPIPYGDVTSPGYLMVTNLGTGTVRVRLSGASNPFAEMAEGQFCFVPTKQSGMEIYCVTGTCWALVRLIED